MEELTKQEVAAIIHQLRQGIGSRNRESPVAKRMVSALLKLEKIYNAMPGKA